MSQRTCEVEGCNRTRVARGMCSSHYSSWHRKVNGRKRELFAIICIVCGAEHMATRRESKYCSDACKGRHYSETKRRKSRLPADHPVMLLIAAERQRSKARKTAPFIPAPIECRWCGAEFVPRIRTQAFCSTDHKLRAKKNRRRGRQYGSTSHFTWAEFARLHIRLGRICAYCESPTPNPEPDHVVPLSRGGSNSITNILPSCSLCNSDKRDLLLDEWAADRKRRALPPRVTDATRWRHLTDAILAA